MSDAEKAIQIGNAVAEYQAAKVNLAHIDKLFGTLGEAYRAAGEAIGSPSRPSGAGTEPRLEQGKLVIGYAYRDMKDLAGLLVGADRLTELVQERDAARLRLREAKQLMDSLGLSGIS